MNFNLVAFHKQQLIIKIICVSWVITKIISYKVWILDRFFPVIPVFNFSNYFSNSIHLILFAVSIILLLLIFYKTKSKKVSLVFLLTEIFSCSLDQMRWQPWEYFYLLVFLFYIISKNQKQFIQLITILLVITYFFSGLNKLNGGFLTFAWKNMILMQMFKIPKVIIDTNLWLYYLGISIALIEICFAFALLFFKNKKHIAILISTMHLFILILLGPVCNYNTVVWPWNICMIFVVLILFYANKERIFCRSLFLNKLNILVFTFLFTTSVLGKFGFWYSQFSFHLYNGNSNKLIIYITNLEKYPKLLKNIQIKKYVNKNNYYELNLSQYALDELSVTLNPDDFTYSKLKNAWRYKYPRTNVHFLKTKYPYKNENKIEIK
jgi:hypothetical protein